MSAKKSTILPIDAVVMKDGSPVTTSLKIAEIFGKRHDNVLRTIKQIDCSEEFVLLNFEETDYLDSSGRTYPMYEMTKDGFIFLAMGFTGHLAAQFREAYIKKFNDMEEQLKEQAAFVQTIADKLTKLQADVDIIKDGMGQQSTQVSSLPAPQVQMQVLEEEEDEDLGLPSLQIRRKILTNWYQLWPELWLTASTLSDQATQHLQLYQLLLQVAGTDHKATVDNRRLGNWLGRNHGIIMSGLMLERGPANRLRIRTWRVVQRS